MQNIPQITLGIVAVSRDCFPIELSQKRRIQVVEECNKRGIEIKELATTIENENDVIKALDEINRYAINALVIYLGNFGPEGPTTTLAAQCGVPVMLAAAAEECRASLLNSRGDAFCGMLNASYNVGLRKLTPYIPEYPVGSTAEIAGMIQDFIPIARVINGLKKLKIFSFGPRPQDFMACNAPIQPLYDLGVEIMENSELDLYHVFQEVEGDAGIAAITRDMARELGAGNAYPDLLDRLARYEYALLTFMERNLGAREYGIFANKCWPAFERYFEFVPCYVNSRLACRGIPVSCEVDIYGALSEYMATCATELPATLLDINNTVPGDMLEAESSRYKPTDLFMGFHCGNTPASCLVSAQLKYQVIMHRLMEPGRAPAITRGTLEGRIKPGEATLFRLQSTAATRLKSYVAEGEVLDIDPQSFGSIGIFAVSEMARFYRHVLIEERFPHHTAVAFKKSGKILFAATKMLGVTDIFYNLPSHSRYKGENPF